jgi:hypothetical protein
MKDLLLWGLIFITAITTLIQTDKIQKLEENVQTHTKCIEQLQEIAIANIEKDSLK